MSTHTIYMPLHIMHVGDKGIRLCTIIRGESPPVTTCVVIVQPLATTHIHMLYIVVIPYVCMVKYSKICISINIVCNHTRAQNRVPRINCKSKYKWNALALPH